MSGGGMVRWIGWTLLAGGLLSLALVLIGYRNARADPLLRHLTVRMPGWPAGTRPVRILVWSDLHLGDRATDETRLTRLVGRAAALRPDMVVLAGDYIAGHRPTDAAVAPGLRALAALRPPLGVVAVLGNHDHWTDPSAVRRALGHAGVLLLSNSAIRRGPVTVGGVDDMLTRHADPAATAEAMRRLGGAPLIVSHSPDLAPKLPPDLPLMVAGHTHCGQIVLPWWGPLAEVASPHYRCGVIRDGVRATVVTAGTGTSVVPLRFGAPPDWWLLTLGG